MEIVAFTTEAHRRRPRAGAILNDSYLIDFEYSYEEGVHPAHLVDWLDMEGPWFQKSRETFDRLSSSPDLVQAAAEKGWVVKRSDAQWFAPVPRPGKVVCIGLNYRDHAAEVNMPLPERPIVFSKFASAIVGDGDPVVLPSTSQQVDYEAELAVVIGRRAKNVSADRALDYVLGYTAFNDVTARDFQSSDGQWQRSKSCDTFAPMGPSIVTTDVITDPRKLGIKLVLNGATMQESNTDQLIFDVPRLIEFISATITLEPGDVIATGTPPGVGVGRKPQVFLKPGDRVTVAIDGLGALTNPIVA
jgi:2-keto-4-pentenoate hydratase/2-oxohepta-3-ene-1,7-dioic acid hydratase in catechol pathway